MNRAGAASFLHDVDSDIEKTKNDGGAGGSSKTTTEECFVKKIEALGHFLDGNEGVFPQQTKEPTKRVNLEEYKLAGTVVKLKAKYRSGSLSSEQRSAVESLKGFQSQRGWTWSCGGGGGGSGSRAVTWRTTLDELKLWVDRTHGVVPSGYCEKLKHPSRTSPDPAEKALGAWVHKQRVAFEACEMCQAREEMLYSVPGWSWLSQDRPWCAMHERLSSWLAEEPDVHCIHALIKSRKQLRSIERILAEWLKEQLGAYRREGGRRLSALQVDKLEAHDAGGIIEHWRGSSEVLSWDEHLAVLEWGGDKNPNSSFPEPAEGWKFDVEHPVHGWIALGHYWYWAQRAIAQRGKEGHGHVHFPWALNDQQRESIERWMAGRDFDEKPMRKKTCRRKDVASRERVSNDESNSMPP